MPQKSEPKPKARRRRQNSASADSRVRLLDAALELMSERPFQRLSARAIAGHAGLDPALVTYHFGNRAGLVAAVAERATAMLRYRMTLGYETETTTSAALMRAVEDPVSVMSGEALFAQIYVSELLLHGNDSTDALLFELAGPYYAEIDAVLQRAARRRDIRQVDHALVQQSIAAVALLPFFLGPFYSRQGRELSTQESEHLAAQMARFLLTGVAGVAAKRSTRKTNSAADGPSRHEIVRVALEILREDHDYDLSSDRIAAALKTDSRAVTQRFPDGDLALEVARAAVRQLPPAVARTRSRGRPAADNPALERDLIAAATKLIAAGDGRVTASAVATEANCDPALVTYYFGGRDGLLQAVAAATLRDSVAHFEAADDEQLPTVPRLKQALRGAMQTYADTPALGPFILDECLVHGTKAGDEVLLGIPSGMWAEIRTLVREGRESGELADATVRDLVYGVGILPFYLVTVIPVFQRALRGPQVAMEHAAICDGVLDMVFNGLLTAKGRAAAEDA